MNEFRCALLAEGNSDNALLPLLRWLLKRNGITTNIVLQRVEEPRMRPYSTRCKMSVMGWRIQESLADYACDLLFVHRDADAPDQKSRVNEIKTGYNEAVKDRQTPFVCVVPIQELEAWLLVDAKAICSACNTRNLPKGVKLPKLGEIERMANPKEFLKQFLSQASGLTAKELRDAGVTAQRIAGNIDFSLLLKLPTFKKLDEELAEVIAANGWNHETPPQGALSISDTS